MLKKKRGRLYKILFAILIAFAVVSFWRGIWGLMDLYLFPNNYELSLISSVLIGILILILTRKTVEHLM